MPVTTGNPMDATAIRPFTIPEVPDGELEALRARIAATRWPDQETVTDDSQGVPLAMVQELGGYWAADYDWRRCAQPGQRTRQPAVGRAHGGRPLSGPAVACSHIRGP
jgi:Epoxide hydrolase N terminus